MTRLHTHNSFHSSQSLKYLGVVVIIVFFKVILLAEVRGFIEVLKNQSKKIFATKQDEPFQANVL